MITQAERTASITNRLAALGKAVCLIGFPAIPMFIYLSKVHPSLPGPSSADSIRQMADQAVRWSQVHFGFSVAGFLGLGVLLILRGLVVTKGPRLAVEIAAIIGVVGGVIFTGTVLMEVSVVPELALACDSSQICVSTSNAVLTDELANQGWRVLPGLTRGGRTMMLGLIILAMIGFASDALKPVEAGPIVTGAVLEFGLNTGLHAWGNFYPSRGMPGMAAVFLLVGGTALAVRLVKEAWRTPESGPSPSQAESESWPVAPEAVDPVSLSDPWPPKPAAVSTPPEEPYPAS